MIEIKNISKTYKNNIKALKNINLYIKKGEKIALLGANGAGKTTLLKTISSFILPDSGEIIINGKNTRKYKNVVNKEISIITSNERSFYYRLSLFENLIFFGMLNNLIGRELKYKVNLVLEQVNLLKDKNIKYMEASTGMKRRLNLARGLLKSANIYLFDEPTSGVDIETKIKIFKMIEQLSAENKTIIIATHDISEIKQTSKIITMNNGVITGEYTSNVFNNINDEEKLLELIKIRKKII
jgi:ABC-2 type transport system ATP-binding protein